MKLFAYLTLLSIVAIATSVMAKPIEFINFGAVYQYEALPAGGRTLGVYTQGPTTWYDQSPGPQGELPGPMPGWDEKMEWLWDFTYTGGALDGTIWRGPFVSDSTIIARDDDGNVIGTLTLAGDGEVAADFGPDEPVVDETSGLFAARYNGPVSNYEWETYQVVGGTGIYENLAQAGEWRLYASGLSWRALRPDLTLPENIAEPILTSTATFAMVGSYEIVPEPLSVLPSFLGLLGLLAFGSRKRTRN